MKKTWKRWLGTVAAALVTSTALAQSPNEAGVVTMRGQSPTYSEEGSVQMGRASASATGTGIQQSQFAVDPGDVFEDALGGNPGGYYAENGGVGFAAPHNLSDIQWRVGNQSMDAYGYNGGYSNINAFIPLSTDGEQSLIFLNPRVNMSGSGNGGVNVGLGYRFFDPVDDRVYGVSGWFDYDAGHRAAYNQMGVSLESLGRYFSARFNANLPLNDFNTFSTTNAFGTPFFQGNNIAYQFRFLREISYQDYKLEIASPVPLLGRYGAEWAIGGYGLVANTSSAKSSMGISGRFELQVSEDFWINTVVSNDKIFGTNTSINLEVTLPNGRQTRWLRPNRGHEKLMASVKRPYRVATATNTVTETQFFRDPKDGTPIQVAHIDPTAVNGAAAGTVLNPFGSIQDYMNLTTAQRSPFDMIYVGRNVVDGSDVDLNTTIELLNCQRLLGTGTLADGSVHQFRAVDRGDGLTSFNLPGFANSAAQSAGANPFLSNSGNVGTPVVRINGNFTEVTGFTIDAGRSADGIASVNAALVPRSVDSFVITNNTIQSAFTAININSDTTPAASGPSTMPISRSQGFNDNIGIVANNTINGTTGTIPNVGVTDGIHITQTAGTGASALNLSVRKNTITGLTGEDIDGDGVIDPGEDLNGNGLLEPGAGIIVTANAGTEILANASTAIPFTGILDNTITNSETGILLTAKGAGSHIRLDAARNTVTGSTDAASGGMIINAVTGLIDVETFSNNVVTGGLGQGIAFTSMVGGDIVFADPVPIGPLHLVADPVILNNTITGNRRSGLEFTAIGAGSTVVVSDLTTNIITGNGGPTILPTPNDDQSNVFISAVAGGNVTLDSVVGNTITGATAGDGIMVVSNGVGSLVDSDIGRLAGLLNTITGNAQNGINVLATNGATAQGSIVNNTISDNTLNGILITALEPGSFADYNNVLNGRGITDNIINGNTAAGISILADNTGALPGGGVQALMLRNTISGAVGNTQEFGIQVLGLRTGDLNIDIGDTNPLNRNTITGNSDANVDVDLAGFSTADVVIQNNIITNALNGPSVDFAGDGVVFRTTDTSRLFNAQVLNNTITGNADDGIRVLANAASQIHATGNPALPGLLVTGNTISGNLGDGIQIQRGGDAIIRSVIGTLGGVGVDPVLGNTITGNTNHGINVITGGGSTPAGVSTRITVGQNTISGNGTTTVGNGVNVVTNDDSQTNVDLISNVIQGLGTQNNGVSVTTNNASVFGVFGGANAQFDGNIITGHSGDGIVLTTSNISQLGVDITGNTQQAIISGNEVNGVSIVDQSVGAVMVVNIGNPASSGAGPGADVFPDAPDVVIAQNGNDAIRVAQIGAGSINLNVNNTLASGNRVTGGVSRHGLSYNSDGQVTSGTANLTVDNSTFVDFGGDGMNFFYDHAFNPFGTQLNVNVTDSIIGQTQFSTNVGDGVDIEVHDNGARFNFDNNTIQNNGGDGFRMVLLAEDMTTNLLNVFPDRDGNGDGTNETTDPDNPALPGNHWADPTFRDFTSNLSLTNNLIRFNGQDGVDLAIGAGTRLGTAGNRTIVRGNTMTGNANNGFLTRTITNALVAPPTDSVNRGENTVDTVRLDPMAFLFLAFGDNVQPNITTQLNPTVRGGVIAAADAIKASPNRDIITLFDVNTNDLNNTINAGLPVSTLGTFLNGWNAPLTITNNVLGQGFIAPINTGNVNNVP